MHTARTSRTLAVSAAVLIAIAGCSAGPTARGPAPADTPTSLPGQGSSGDTGVVAGGALPTSAPSAAAPAASGDWPNTTLQPCSLLTDQQVAAAVGMKVDHGTADKLELDTGSRGCTWTTEAGDAGAGPDKIASVTLEVSGPNPAIAKRFPTAQSYFDFEKTVYADQSKTLPGIGDDAFLHKFELWARHGDVVLRIFATLGTDIDVPPVLQTLMKQALTNT